MTSLRLTFTTSVTVIAAGSVPFAGSLGFVFVSQTATPPALKTAKKISSASFVSTYAHGCNLARRLRVVMSEPIPTMKKNFLIIAILAGLVSIASAASNQTNNEVLVLPAYVVTAPRYAPAEQKVKAELKELSRQALAPDLNLLKPHAAKPVTLAHGGKDIVAKPQAKS